MWLRSFPLLLRVVAVLLRRGFAHSGEVLSGVFTGYGQFIVLCGAAPTDSNHDDDLIKGLFTQSVSINACVGTWKDTVDLYLYHPCRVSVVMLALLLENGFEIHSKTSTLTLMIGLNRA